MLNLRRYGSLLALLGTIWPIVNAHPVSNPASLFPLISNPLQPSERWGTQQKPFPTNAWFINFMMQSKANTLSDPVNCFPYLLRTNDQGIHVSYSHPYFYAEPHYFAIISAIFYPFQEQVTLGTQEKMVEYGLASYHGLGVTLHWKDMQKRGFSTPILQGSPYLSAFFSKSTPTLRSGFKWSLVSPQLQEGVLPPTQRLELRLELNQLGQTWIVYSEKPIRWQLDKHTLTSLDPYTGWLRLVLQKDAEKGLVNDKQLLDNYSQTIPLDYEQTYDQSGYQIHWKTQNAQAPLMLSLPHQYINFPFPRDVLLYSGIKGPMVGQTLSTWNIKLPNIAISFSAKTFSDYQKEQLHAALTQETQLLLQRDFIDEGPYQVGKGLTRVAQLIIIADEIKAYDLKKKLLLYMEGFLAKKISTKKKWWFAYDTTWGGIIPSTDYYGAQHYNDHHFHYGYWVYAFAVIAHFDPQWLSTPLQDSKEPKEWIETLIRDYANPNPHDPYFPMQRYQDDYAGHSWASGLTSFMDGQNQQSVSEAVHAYYALALYAQAIHNQNLFKWGHFLLARELVAGQTYWQVKKNSLIYSELFTANNAIVGNLWGSKVDANAFFFDCKKYYRCGLEFSYGIEMLPFTPITRVLLDPLWLKEAAPIITKLILNEYGPISDAWRWILIKGLSPIMSPLQKAFFFKRAVESKPEAYDNGDSKTYTLYFLI